MSRTHKDSIRREFLAQSHRARLNNKLRRFVRATGALPNARIINDPLYCEERGIALVRKAS